MVSTTLAVSTILLSHFVNAVNYKGKDYDDSIVREGLQLYEEFMRKKLGGFTLLPQAQETQWEAEAFGVYGKKDFETALETNDKWINPVTKKHFKVKNYAVVSVGSTSTQSVATVNGEVKAMTIKGSGTFGAMQGLSEKQVGDFLGHVKTKLSEMYGVDRRRLQVDTENVNVFFINSIEFAVADGLNLIALDGEVPDASLTLTAKNNKAALTAQKMAIKWKKLFAGTQFKAFIKAKKLDPKVSNAWRDIAVKKAGVIGVCDIGGGLSINVVTLTETKKVVKGGYKAKGKKTINELFIEEILDFKASGAGTPELMTRLLKARVQIYGREVLRRIQLASKNLQEVLKLKQPLLLKEIHAYQTGLTRWFWEQLSAKTTTKAKQVADDYYYEEYEYEEEYNEQVEIYKAGYMKGYEDAFARLQRMQGAQTRPMVHKRHKDYV